MTRIAELFNIREGEGRVTSLMLLHAFFMGVSTVFFETAASALFLTSYDESVIPFAYIGAAIVSTITGIAYSRLRDRLTFWNLMNVTLLFLLVTVVGFRFGLSLSNAAWLSFGLFVWYRVLSILTDLEYWAVASRIYDVRQGKRLFSFIGSGEVVARIVGSFSVPLFVATVGVANLIFISAIGLAMSFVVVVLLYRQHGRHEEAAEAAEQVNPDEPTAGLKQLKAMFGNRYIVIIFAVAIMGVLGKYFVDFAFLQQMQVRYTDVENLAGFFGVFSGVTQLMNLLMRVFVSGRVLNRFGIRVGLLILPAAHVLCTLAIVVSGTLISGDLALVFWLAIANQGIYKTFKHPFDNPSMKVLYQPLSKAVRLTVQIVNEVIVSPITIGIAGVIMILFSRVITFDPVTFAWVMLVTFILWIVAAGRAYSEYGTALLEAIRSRIIDDIVFEIGDETSLKVVKQRLRSSNSGDVLFALSLLEQAGSRDIQAAVVELSNHPSPDVRRHVFELVGRRRLAGLASKLEAAAFSGLENPQVREAAIQSFALVGDADDRAEVAKLLESSNARYRRAAMLGLLGCGDPQFVRQAREVLWRDARSAETDRRRLAAKVVGRAGSADRELHLTLLTDPVRRVRQAAVEHSVGTTDVTVLRALIPFLSDSLLAGDALRVLVAAGDEAVALLEEELKVRTVERSGRLRMVRALGRIPGGRSAQVLRGRLDEADDKVRAQVLDELANRGHVVAEDEQVVIETRMRSETRQLTSRLAILNDLPDGESFGLLRRAIKSELEEGRRRLFNLAAIGSNPSIVGRARDSYLKGTRETRAYAVEILDMTLPDALKNWILPVVEDLPPKARLERLSRSFVFEPRSVEKRLLQLAMGEGELAADWTRIAAMHTIESEGLDSLRPELEKADQASLPEVVRDSLIRVLQKLGDPTYTRDSESGDQSMFSTVERVIILKSVPVFAEASEQLLAEVASVLEEVEATASELIFDKGDVGNSMYIIVSGRVRVHDGDRTIVHLGERDVFGELAALDPEPRSAAITAAEPTQLFRLDREPLLEVMADHVEIVSGVFHVLCQRLRAATSGVRTDDVGPPDKQTPESSEPEPNESTR